MIGLCRRWSDSAVALSHIARSALAIGCAVLGRLLRTSRLWRWWLPLLQLLLLEPLCHLVMGNSSAGIQSNANSVRARCSHHTLSRWGLNIAISRSVGCGAWTSRNGLRAVAPRTMRTNPRVAYLAGRSRKVLPLAQAVTMAMSVRIRGALA